MRVIDMEAKGNICTASEKLLGWKATGSPGPAGPQGPAGPKGATGAQGPAGIAALPGDGARSPGEAVA